MDTPDDELATIKKRMMDQILAERQVGANAPDAPVKVTDADFNAFVARHPAVVIDFWAPWCGPCKAIAPTLDALAKELKGKVVIGKLNVDENPVTPGRFQVQGIPTMVLFRGGKPVDRIVGAVPKPQLAAALHRLVS